MAKITAPFTSEQVVYLEIWQAGWGNHPFACVNHHDGKADLVPCEEGWKCLECGYTQNWAHDFMCGPELDQPVTSWIQREFAKQKMLILQEMYQDWIAARLITGDVESSHLREAILQKEMLMLQLRINEYEFSNQDDTHSSKEDPSSMEGNAE